MELPHAALPAEEVRRRLERAGADDVDWRHGRGWSLVYDSPGAHRDLVRAAAERFADENGLSHAAFPSAARFESAVISMVASVVNPRVRSYGLFSSGGNESTLVALKAYRDRRRDEQRDRGGSIGGSLSVVVPVTAHPAFGKAAAYLGLELRSVPCGPQGAPEPADLLAAVDPTTVAVGLSAPCYPFGVVDPVAEVAAAAAERGVGVHVDAALGGLFLPFLPEPVRFGLDIPGVTSVAVDLHKYGYAAKGASVVLFADPQLRRHAYHVSVDWPGGAFASPGVLGTRPVGVAAAAYAAMVALGRQGYAALVEQVMATTRDLQEGLQARGRFHVVGTPPMSVFAAASDQVAVGTLARGLQQRGWWIDAQSDPDALHFIVFPRHAEVLPHFLDDLEQVLADAPADGSGQPAEGLASYGVVVRGGRLTPETLLDSLDARFDGEPW